MTLRERRIWAAIGFYWFGYQIIVLTLHYLFNTPSWWQ